MAVDYDVVIIGGSLAGRYAAIAATHLGATVALIEPPTQAAAKPLLDLLTPHALSEIGQLTQQLSNVVGIPDQSGESIQWEEAMQWTESVVSNLEEQNSPIVLAALGVDVILGNGHFESLPHIAFTVNERRLRSRAYLIATNSRPRIPDIEGLQSTGYITSSEIWRSLTSLHPPKRWVILGGDPSGIQLAQTLTRLGLDVTLIVKRSHILPKEDLDIAQLLQATLEAEGVRVLTQTLVTQVKRIQDQHWVQAGDQAIETDQILICAGQQPNVEDLNLEAVGVKWNQHRLILNEKLQTTNPRIYACGDVIGGYQFANIATYEARIALKNALFFPMYKVNYRSIPWAIFSEPQLARVGLTEAQARRNYGNTIVVLRQYFKSVAAAQLSGETTGICKLILLENGVILGAVFVGTQAIELINVVALAIAQNLKVDALTQLVPIYPSLSEIVAQLAVAWRRQRIHRNIKLRNFLESFFNFRRSWSR